MRYTMMTLAIILAASGGAMDGMAQTTTEPPPAPSSQPIPPPTAPAPTAALTPAPPPGPKAKDYQGLDVFASDSQQIGKVTKVAELPDGKIGNIEVHSSGFFGYFAKVYVLPAAQTTLKSGRVELAVTSEQAKQWLK